MNSGREMWASVKQSTAQSVFRRGAKQRSKAKNWIRNHQMKAKTHVGAYVDRLCRWLLLTLLLIVLAENTKCREKHGKRTKSDGKGKTEKKLFINFEEKNCNIRWLCSIMLKGEFCFSCRAKWKGLKGREELFAWNFRVFFVQFFGFNSRISPVFLINRSTYEVHWKHWE